MSMPYQVADRQPDGQQAFEDAKAANGRWELRDPTAREATWC
jgi:hypothetical protein